MISKIEFLTQKCQTLLMKHRDSGDINSITFILFFLCLLFLFALCAVIIKYGCVLRYFGLLFILIMLLFNHKRKMNKAAAANLVHANYSSIDPSHKIEYANALSKYIKSGFDLKVQRLVSVRLFYIMLVPLFILMIKEFFYGEMTLVEYLVGGSVLYLVNYIVWTFYFREEIRQCDELRMEITRIETELKEVEIL